MKLFIKNRILWFAVTILCYVASLLILYTNHLKIKKNIEVNAVNLEEMNNKLKTYLEDISNKQSYLNSLQQQKNTLENQVKNLN